MDWSAHAMTDPAGNPDLSDIGVAGALLTIDLAALRANYRLLRDRVAPAECAGVIKADGYGLGAAHVARALVAEGCRTLIVAHLSEALVVRKAVPEAERVIVLHGPTPGAEATFHANGIIPVLNSPEQIAGWAGLSRALGQTLPALLQVDTGMSRFGLSEMELADLLARPDGLAGIGLLYVMSHLACADEPERSASATQLAAFQRMRAQVEARVPGVKASLSASSGIFLGPDYHFDLVRPGAALYGVTPQPGRPNPLRAVIGLQGRVVQTRTVPTGTPIGYGHTVTTTRPTRLATVAVGYADGFLRSTGEDGAAWFGETRLPLMGRVSMDSIIFDTTDLPEPIAPGALVELIGPHRDIDAVAQAAGTIGYEILTGLGHRYARRIIGG